MVKLIVEIDISTTDANDMVRGVELALITCRLNVEIDSHFGYGPSGRISKAATRTDRHRNGSYPKTGNETTGRLPGIFPWNMAETFIPTMDSKESRRLTAFNDTIVSFFARGLIIRDTQHHTATAMRVDISHETISAITDAVLNEVTMRQSH